MRVNLSRLLNKTSQEGCSWFLDNPELNWTPDEALLQFIVRARAEHRPLVYIGFGSITVPHARALTRSVVKAVLKSACLLIGDVVFFLIWG